VILNEWARRTRDAEAAGASRKELLEMLGEKRSRLGMFEGDLEEGELEIGQISSAISDLPTAAEVVGRIVAGYKSTLARL